MNMALNNRLDLLVGLIYGSLQTTGLLVYSLYGFYYVDHMRKSKALPGAHAADSQSCDGKKSSTKDTDSKTIAIELQLQIVLEKASDVKTKDAHDNPKSFCREWCKVVWKMRGIYSSFVVHSFDIATDIMVVVQWWHEEDNKNDIPNVDTRTMAYCSILIILTHKFISSFAVYASTEASEAIESTTSFKYIRSMEAIFESTPQAVLQIVYVMRTYSFGDSQGGNDAAGNNVILYLSIVQSIISMTNSILKDDNTRGMQGEKWKPYRKRLPPTTSFLKHAIARLCQVINRVGILSLFWTVVGGLGFSILIGCEMIMVIVKLGTIVCGVNNVTLEDIVLSLNHAIVLPPESIWDIHTRIKLKEYLVPCGAWENCTEVALVCCFSYCFCAIVPAFVSSLCAGFTGCSDNVPIWVSLRLGTSLIEMVIITMFGIYHSTSYNDNFLFWKPTSGLIVYLVVIIAYMIDCMYLQLFPNFSLPFDIGSRSRYGLAFSGELKAMKSFKMKKSMSPQEFWDQEILYKERPVPYVTCATFALANKQYHVVGWLEKQGASRHKKFKGNYEIARRHINTQLEEKLVTTAGQPYNSWIES